MADRRVGQIGLGLLGSALAERLLAAGFEVAGHDLSEDRRRALVQLGGSLATPAEIARCERILLCLPTNDHVGEVLDELEPRLAAGTIVIDTTTGAPEASVAAAARLAARGVSYLDATVVGSSAEARRGEVVVLVGGDKAACEACRDLFAAFARAVHHVGPSGSGATMKLVVNLVLGLHRAVLAEGLHLAHRAGLDAAAALAVLRDSSAYSRVMDAKGDRMVQGDLEPVARLAQHLKDVRLILDLGQHTGSRLALTELHERLLAEAEAMGFGEADNSAILRWYEPEGLGRPSGNAPAGGDPT